jgi:hypothetical protein
VREAAASLAAEAGVAIEHVAKSHVRMEAVVAKVLERRGDHPGLVHVISAMEACAAYEPWHDKQTHKTYLRDPTTWRNTQRRTAASDLELIRLCDRLVINRRLEAAADEAYSEDEEKLGHQSPAGCRHGSTSRRGLPNWTAPAPW